MTQSINRQGAWSKLARHPTTTQRADLTQVAIIIAKDAVNQQGGAWSTLVRH